MTKGVAAGFTSNSPKSITPAKRPNRTRKRGAALSIKEIRQAAQTPTKPIKSARKQILSWTSESPPPKTSHVLPVNLPEKYEILCGVFDSLDSAICLLKLKASMPTFTNIRPKVECLTDRRFSYGHLAQLKHILPEAIEIKRIMLFVDRLVIVDFESK